jgi:hypothetical protein
MAEIQNPSLTNPEEAEIDGDQKDDQNPYDDVAAISARIDRALSIDRFQRSLFEREWFRNVLFLAGQQWVVWDRGRWRPRALPAWFPKALTNKMMEKYNDLMAQLITGHRIPITALPATDDKSDEATAEVYDRMREVVYTEARIDDKEEEIAGWLVATGNSFIIPSYSMDEETGVSFVQHQECMVCGNQMGPTDLAENGGRCGVCTDAGLPGDNLKPAVDPEGNPIGDEYPIGAITAEVASPFEIRLDHRIVNLRDQRRFVRQHRYDLDFAKEKWDKFEEVIKPDWGNDLSQYYLDVLAHVTSSFAASGGFIGGGPAAPKNPKVTAYEFYELPTKKFPQGLRAVRLGANSQAVVEAGPLSSKYGAGVRKGQYFLPLIHFRFARLPGRFWGKTPLDDAVPLQIFRNTVEANLRLSSQRMGNAIWLNPKGSGISVITGEPGLKMDYNPVSMGGSQFAKPERIPAELENVQPLIMLMNKIDDSIERVVGTFFLQGGDTPPGVTAASALAYLGEKAQKSISTLMTSYAKSWRDFEVMCLEIARENWDDARIRVIAGKNKKYQVAKFTKADLQGAVNLIIDYNGMFPKSNATERATIAQLIQLQVISAAEPEVQWQILKAFGETNLKGSQDIDVQDAAREEDSFMTDPTFMPVIRPFVDNSTVHLQSHTDLAKTDEFRELPPDRQQLWIEHIKNTVTDIISRRVALTQVGLDPDIPATSELSSGDATLAAQVMAANQNGGVPNGAEGPDGRLGPDGIPQPQGPPQTPDIAAGAGAISPGATASINSQPSPAAINIPGANGAPQ